MVQIKCKTVRLTVCLKVNQCQISRQVTNATAFECQMVMFATNDRDDGSPMTMHEILHAAQGLLDFLVGCGI